MSLIDLLQFVENKTIALVGGGVQDSEIAEIKKRDLICGVHNHAQKIGLNPDVVVLGWCKHSEVDISKARFCIINIANPDAHRWIKDCAIMGQGVFLYDTRSYRGVNPNGPHFEWCNVFAKELNTQPFTGVYAMKLLLSLPVKELFVSGFTFYRKDDGTCPERMPPHSLKPQIQWFNRVKLADGRLALVAK